MNLFARNVKINSKYVNTDNATIYLTNYQTDMAVTAVILEYDYQEMTEKLVISVNLADYNLFPPSNQFFFAPNYSEHEGIPESLEAAGIAQIVDSVKIGYGEGYLMMLNS